MQGFRIPRQLESFRALYPLPSDVLRAAAGDGHDAATTLAQLWLSEGIPAAFAGCPAIYDAMRLWLGGRLAVHPKTIGVVGSARLGRSLAPQKLDRPFGATSDLDLFVVSRKLFESVSRDFLQWKEDYEEGRVQPRTGAEQKYWPDNRDRCTGWIERWGFMDPKRIPNREPYPIACSVAQTMFLLARKLERTSGAPTVKEASVRCYADWGSAITRMRENLRTATPLASD